MVKDEASMKGKKLHKQYLQAIDEADAAAGTNVRAELFVSSQQKPSGFVAEQSAPTSFRQDSCSSSVAQAPPSSGGDATEEIEDEIVAGEVVFADEDHDDDEDEVQVVDEDDEVRVFEEDDDEVVVVDEEEVTGTVDTEAGSQAGPSTEVELEVEDEVEVEVEVEVEKDVPEASGLPVQSEAAAEVAADKETAWQPVDDSDDDEDHNTLEVTSSMSSAPRQPLQPPTSSATSLVDPAEVIEGWQKVPVRCAISSLPLLQPAKGRECAHRGTVNLLLLRKEVSGGRAKRCPSCMRPLNLREVIADDKFKVVLDKLRAEHGNAAADARGHVWLHADGAVSLVDPLKTAGGGGRNGKRRTAFVDLDEYDVASEAAASSKRAKVKKEDGGVSEAGTSSDAPSHREVVDLT